MTERLGLLISLRLSLRFSARKCHVTTWNCKSLTLLDLKIFRRDELHVLVRHRVAQGLQLLRRASVVLQHHEEGLGAREGALAPLPTRHVLALAEGAAAARPLRRRRALREELVVNLLD